MSIIKSFPTQKWVNNIWVLTSETSIVSENEYSTDGESCIVVKGVSSCNITLNHETTEHVVIKCLTKTIIKPSIGKIDEEYDEIESDKGACIEFRCIEKNWYVLSSDGLKFS